MSIMRTVVIAMLLLAALKVDAQKLYKISLADFKIDTKNINFSIAEVLDARKEKNSIGLIQTGLNNKPVFASFEKPGLAEIEDLIKNSDLHSPSNGISLRVTTIKISENTTLIKETAKAELSIDFFIRYKDLYYYVSSVFASAEPGGIDVTSKQAANIATAIERAFVTFSKRKNEVDTNHSFTKEELLDPTLTLRDPLTMPILNDVNYNDGYYASFDEFLNNRPSIPFGCKVRLSTPVSFMCDEEEMEVPTLYGFASNNKLYILYHDRFFELNRRNDTFYFKGPSRMAKGGVNKVTQMYLGFSSIGASYIVPGGRYSSIYIVDMETGAVRNVTGF